jgi:hypothetical protein
MAGMSEGIERDEDPVVLEAPATEPRRYPSIYEQYERNLAIVAARCRRVPWTQIAREHGISVRRGKRIFEEWRELNPTLRHHDPVEIVDELLYGYQATLEDLEKVAATTQNDANRIGALNAKMRCYREIAELLQAIGALPNDLGTMHLHIDGQVTAERIITVLERYGVGEEVFDGILDALGGPPRGLEAGASPA